MKTKDEVQTAMKGETCPNCGGPVFTSAQGKKCIGACKSFRGGQREGVDHTPRRVPNAGAIGAAISARPASQAVTSGRIA
jgi:hypothetical protein